MKNTPLGSRTTRRGKKEPPADPYNPSEGGKEVTPVVAPEHRSDAGKWEKAPPGDRSDADGARNITPLQLPPARDRDRENGFFDGKYRGDIPS